MNEFQSKNIFEEKCRTYQKWLNKIRSVRLNAPVLIMWLTDSSDKDTDKLFLTKSKKVAGALDHKRLFQYLQDHQHMLPDPVNTITWLNHVRALDFISPTEYSLRIIEQSLEEKRFNKASITQSIDFINLYNDLAEQLGDNAFHKRSKTHEIRELWEFGYNEIFWQEYICGEEISAVKAAHFSTDMDLLLEQLNQLIEAFIDKIEIIE